ncbi:MAG: DUF2695 domain-containing protein [Aristaeellaceae bacterium]
MSNPTHSPTSMPSGTYQALFCNGSYYLPVDTSDAQAKLADAVAAGHPAVIRAVELSEYSDVPDVDYEHGVCLAPYFIADYQHAPEDIVLEYPRAVYPAQVELLTQQEYNDRLRAQVMAHCNGCRGFGGLNEHDSSLSGHFDEITLNGFCPYRWETRNRPRVFIEELEDFGLAWGRFSYGNQDADAIMDDIEFYLRLRYTSGALVDEADDRTLVLYAEKPTLLHTVLTDLLEKCVSLHWQKGYHIRLNGRADISEAAVMKLLTPKKIAATRKGFSRYGVMLAVLAYDPDGDESVRMFLQTLVDEYLACVLHEASGKAICLFTAKRALMRLRSASPMLGVYNASVTVYDAQQTVQYKVSYDMPQTVLDVAPVNARKESRLNKKFLKAEEGKVLKREQADQLFRYLSARLNASECDHTLRFTEYWLRETLPPDMVSPAIEEIQGMGGFCDCEVLMNCYEDYELE